MPVDEPQPMIWEVRPWYQKWTGTRSIYSERHMRFITGPSTRSALEQRMTLAPRTQRELLIFLDLRLKIADRAKVRSTGFAGRLYNVLSGENYDYLRLTGSELKDVLQVIGACVDDIVNMHARFDLRVDVAREAFLVLTQEAEV
jgi:hypothetical protein